MPYLLDTCVISELRKPRCNAGVSKWMAGIDPAEAYLSVITLGEVRHGIELRRLNDPTGAVSLERWLVGLENHYGDRILPITAEIADRWGRISPSQMLPTSDGLIAASALAHKLAVVTRNVGDFVRSGANTLNPYS